MALKLNETSIVKEVLEKVPSNESKIKTKKYVLSDAVIIHF